MSKIEQSIFEDILFWFANNIQPGADHVVFCGQIYYTDSKSDMLKLYKLWKDDKS